MIDERYKMNHSTIKEEEMSLLKNARVGVIGCGGLGGYNIELLARIGIGHLVVADGDVFAESNLNRQLLSTESNLYKSKADEASNRVTQINSDIQITTHDLYLDRANAFDILEGCHVAIDALDNVKSRLILEETCGDIGIPLIHGAIGGWYGQVAVVLPGSGLLTKLYSSADSEGEEKILGNPSFTPACIASIQVAECIKYLLKKGSTLINSVLQIDLLSNSFDVIEV